MVSIRDGVTCAAAGINAIRKKSADRVAAFRWHPAASRGASLRWTAEAAVPTWLLSTDRFCRIYGFYSLPGLDPGLSFHSGLRFDSYCAHHAPGLAALGTVGEQQLWMAVGTERRGLDIFLRHSGGDQLLTVRFDEVEEGSLGQHAFAVSGSASGQK